MGRLIDADELKNCIENGVWYDLLALIDVQPTAYDVDAVVEELDRLRVAEYDYESEEEPEDFDEMLADAESSGKIKAYLKAADIVRKGGAE